MEGERILKPERNVNVLVARREHAKNVENFRFRIGAHLVVLSLVGILLHFAVFVE